MNETVEAAAARCAVHGVEHWADKKGVRLFLWEKFVDTPGGKPAVLFVHGSSMASQPTFDLTVPGRPDSSVMDWFAKRGFACWSVDMEGYGRSDKSRDIACDIANGADDLAAATDYMRRTRGIDWTKTSAFANFSDLHGYIRINRQGRERAGIVAAEEYEALRDRIIAGLSTFVDADTGEPIVEEARRIEDVYPNGTMLEHLPDLVVRWTPSPAADHRSVTSRQFGTLDWPTPGRHPQGRSGNHRDQGFLIAAGPDIAAVGAPNRAHILDLAPTAFALLGLKAPKHMQGISLFAAKMAADAVH